MIVKCHANIRSKSDHDEPSNERDTSSVEAGNSPSGVFQIF